MNEENDYNLFPPVDTSGSGNFGEQEFMDWYKDVAAQRGYDPNPYDPEHHYDYRAAYNAGAGYDETGHWPSPFKDKGNERRYLSAQDPGWETPPSPHNELRDTATGKPAPLDLPHMFNFRTPEDTGNSQPEQNQFPPSPPPTSYEDAMRMLQRNMEDKNITPKQFGPQDLPDMLHRYFGPSADPYRPEYDREPQLAQGGPSLRGRQPSDDPYSELRMPHSLSETGNFRIPDTDNVRDMLRTPPQTTEEMLAMYDPGGGLGAGAAGGMVKWAGKAHPNAYVFRGMGDPTAEVEALRELIGKSQKIVTPIEQAGSLISPKFVKRARPEGVLYDADTAMGDIGNIGISDTYSSYYPQGKMFRTENIDRALGRVENRLQGEGIWTQGPVTRTPGGGESFTEFPTEKAHRYNYAKDKLQEMQQGIKESDTFQDARRNHLMRDPNETSLEDFFGMQGSRYATQSDPAHAYSELTNRLGPGFENRMAGVNVDPNNPNPALLQLAKDRDLKVFGLPYGAEPNLSKNLTRALDRTEKKYYNSNPGDFAGWVDGEATYDPSWRSQKYVNALEKLGDMRIQERLNQERQPWKSMMTSENPTGGEWVEKVPPNAKLRSNWRQYYNLPEEDLQKIADALGRIRGSMEYTPADIKNIITRGGEFNDPFGGPAGRAITEVLGEHGIKPHLTSSELPHNFNFNYSGHAFPSE